MRGAEVNEAKKVLASEATALLHGRAAAEAAAATARKTFEEGELAESLPSVDIPASEISDGFGVLSAFVRAGLVASTGEARRQIKGGGLRVNDAAVTDERATIGRGRPCRREASSNSRSAARSMSCCARSERPGARY